MPIIVRLLSWANGRPLNCAGQYIKAVDVQLAPESDMWLQITEDRDEAKRWATVEDFSHVYREVLESDPIRPDGEPNRPLTALTVELCQTNRKG